MELVLKDTKKMMMVSEKIFSYEFNEALVHQIVMAYTASKRQGTRAQKNRAEVSGSGKKPWRQKGTGRARAGSVKSPIWRSGGVTFAAKYHNKKKKMNKKMYRGALKSILSELVRQNRLMIVQSFTIEAPKTKRFLQKLKDMDLKKVLIILEQVEKNIFLSARNLYKVDVRNLENMDLISLILFDHTVITVDVVKKIEEMLI